MSGCRKSPPGALHFLCRHCLGTVLNSVTFLLNLTSAGFFSANTLGAVEALVFLVISLTDIFYLAFWLFWAGSCASLFHLVSLSSSFSSNRIFIDFHYSARKKGIKVSLALLSLFFPYLHCLGVAAVLGAVRQFPLALLCSHDLEPENGWLPLPEQTQCFVRLPIKQLEECSVGSFLFYQQSPHTCLSYCVTV